MALTAMSGGDGTGAATSILVDVNDAEWYSAGPLANQAASLTSLARFPD